MRINGMKIKNLFLAIYDQLTRKGAWRNIFVTHNAFGIFSRYSHIARGSGKPKMSYPTKAVAMKAAKAMSEKHGVHFSVYKCAWCDNTMNMMDTMPAAPLVWAAAERLVTPSFTA